MKQKTLVWISVPFSDFSAQKIRPGLVVSNDAYNEKNQDVVICAVTSNIQKTEYSVQLEQKDLVDGKLPIKSKIKADKIMQIDKKFVMKNFGEVNDKKFDETIVEIKKLISKNK